MLERFLHYSLRHGRPIRLVYQVGGDIKSENLQVLAMDGHSITCQGRARTKKPQAISRDDLLAASYVRGDKGELSSFPDIE